MKYKNLGTLILAVGIALSGCKETKRETSEILYQDAIVSSKYHRNAYTQLMPIGKSLMPILHPEVNRINFDGNIDFEINNKSIYSRFREGDKARVAYKEIYTLTYDDINDDGKKELIEKRLTDYDFISAYEN